ncbi:MAG TPA: DJ-1/PfpI family protein [Planctomycetota bacterium]|nr:DJ-1/PfpI family protein [Planctomycetota bacterium]
MTSVRVLIPLADGFEEIEVVTVADILVRAGATVSLAAIGGERTVRGSRGLHLVADHDFVGDEEADLVYLPGGAEGARRLGEDERVLALLRRFEASEAWIAAICAAPTVLAKAGVGGDRRMTSHPTVADEVRAHAAEYAEESIVFDGKLVTGRGPGVALDFALDLVGLLFGAEHAAEVRGPLMCEVVH